MDTLKQHNDNVAGYREMMQANLGAGVACNDCGTEMRFRDEASKRIDMGSVRCPKCGATGYKENT